MITKAIGFVIFIIGFIFTLYSGLGFITKEKVVSIGSFEMTKESQPSTTMSPFVGIGAMIIGGIIFVSGSRNHFRTNETNQ